MKELSVFTNKKGFILLNTIIIFTIIADIVTSILAISNYNLTVLSRDRQLNEMIEIEEKIIQRVRNEFESYSTNDFVTYRNGCVISVVYDGSVATVNITGRYNYVCHIRYDDYSQSIKDYWYDD